MLLHLLLLLLLLLLMLLLLLQESLLLLLLLSLTNGIEASHNRRQTSLRTLDECSIHISPRGKRNKPIEKSFQCTSTRRVSVLKRWCTEQVNQSHMKTSDKNHAIMSKSQKPYTHIPKTSRKRKGEKKQRKIQGINSDTKKHNT